MCSCGLAVELRADCAVSCWGILPAACLRNSCNPALQPDSRFVRWHRACQLWLAAGATVHHRERERERATLSLVLEDQ
jgi:hypothetical protein